MSLILTLSILYTLACGRPNRQHITGLTYPLTNLKARKHCTTKNGANVPHGSSNCWHQSSVLWLVACVDDCIACWPSAKFFFCLSTSTFIAGNISIIIPWVCLCGSNRYSLCFWLGLSAYASYLWAQDEPQQCSPFSARYRDSQRTVLWNLQIPPKIPSKRYFLKTWAGKLWLLIEFCIWMQLPILLQYLTVCYQKIIICLNPKSTH